MSPQNQSESNGSMPWYVYDCTLSLDGDSKRMALFLLYLLVFVTGLLQNAVVLWVNWRRRHTADGVLFCAINVSLSDSMMLAVLPAFIMEVTLDKVWLWGRFLCKFTNLIYVINFYSSSFFLAAMTLERYLALSRPRAPPLFPAAGRRRWALCGALWLLALLLALLENVHVDLLEWSEPGCYLLPEHNYGDWFIAVTFLCLLFQFLGPAALIVTCNVLIARAARRLEGGGQRRRDVWLVHVYSLVFVLCWAPYHLVMFLMMVDTFDPFIFSCNAIEFMYFSFSLVQCLSLFHCVANPLLYNFLSQSFRSNLVGAVLDRLPPHAVAQRAAAAAVGGAGGGAQAGPQRKLSEGSTSQSDVGS